MKLETAKPEDIYSEDDKFESLVIDSQTEHGFDDLSQLLSALEEEESSTDSEAITSTNEDTILQDLYGYEPVINMPIAREMTKNTNLEMKVQQLLFLIVVILRVILIVL